MWVIYIRYVAASLLNSPRCATSLSDGSITLDFNRGRTEFDFFPLCGTYILTVPQEVGAAGQKPYNADTAKVSDTSSAGSESISILCLYRVELFAWRRVRAYFQLVPRIFPLSLSLFLALWKLHPSGRTMQRFCFECLIRAGYSRWFAWKRLTVQTVLVVFGQFNLRGPFFVIEIIIRINKTLILLSTISVIYI